MSQPTEVQRCAVMAALAMGDATAYFAVALCDGDPDKAEPVALRLAKATQDRMHAWLDKAKGDLQYSDLRKYLRGWLEEMAREFAKGGN